MVDKQTRSSIRRQNRAATCILGLWGAVLHKLTDRARGAGCGPVRIRPRRGGGRSSWHPATSSLGRTARGGGGRREVGNFHGGGGKVPRGSGGSGPPEGFEL